MTYRPGSHGLLDLYGCSDGLLRDEGRLKTVLRQAAEAAGATVLDGRFHTFGDAGGVTGVLLLAESHISIHTWPEHRFAAVDIFLCGGMPLEAARISLETAFAAEKSAWTVQLRGADVQGTA